MNLAIGKIELNSPVGGSRIMNGTGGSGDLAPLAHCALALLGEGEVRVNGELQDAGEALAAAGISFVVSVGTSLTP